MNANICLAPIWLCPLQREAYLLLKKKKKKNIKDTKCVHILIFLDFVKLKSIFFNFLYRYSQLRDLSLFTKRFRDQIRIYALKLKLLGDIFQNHSTLNGEMIVSHHFECPSAPPRGGDWSWGVRVHGEVPAAPNPAMTSWCPPATKWNKRYRHQPRMSRQIVKTFYSFWIIKLN